MKSEILESKRVLNIQIKGKYREEETVYFTIGNGNGTDCKIEFYGERWRSANEWSILLKGILSELDSLKEEGLIE